MNVEIRTIPECIVYTKAYDVEGLMSFFNVETDENILYDLQYLMQDENPGVVVPEDGTDYNFFEFPFVYNEDGTRHIVYHDLVLSAGKDSPTGEYHFETMPAIEAACYIHVGNFESVDEGFEKLYQWIEENGYEITGTARCSAEHGPWDTEDQNQYSNELQVPVRKK